MIDNVGQDEWFNLYLYLGSCWVNKSRYEARYSIRYRTQSPDLNQKESWSIDRAETENQSWTQGVSTRKSSWNQFQNHLLKKDQFVDDLFQSSSSTGSTRNLSNLSRRTRISLLCSCSLRRTYPDFSSQYFQVKVQVMKFLISYRTTSDVIGIELEIIRDH
jgi:hypothetical protein